MGPSAAAVLELARRGEEVFKIGEWSVRRLDNADIGIVYLNETTGQVEVQPPTEVLDALDLDAEGGDTGGADPAEGDAMPDAGQQEAADEATTLGAASTAATSADEGEASAASAPGEAYFRRIILGAKTDMPLRMARDIHEALVEDPSLFVEVQRRFSDAPGEKLVSIGDGLGEELEAVAMGLRPGQVSDVIATDIGVQILLRVT